VKILAYSSYDVYLTMVSSTPTVDYREFMQQNSTDQFENASNAYWIKHKNRSTGTYTDVLVRLTKPYKFSKVLGDKKEDWFKILFSDFDYTVYLGDIFEFDDYRWMVIDTNTIKGTTKSVVVKRCNIQLKFVEALPLDTDVITIDSIGETKIFDIENDKYILLPKGSMRVRIPHDSNSLKIKVSPDGTRFLLGSPLQSWSVENIDSISAVRPDINGNSDNGYVELILKQMNDKFPDDDLINGVAYQDYF
jgi:hypothetical protein